MLSLLILVSTVIGTIEGIPLIKKKMWKELITTLFLIVTAIFLGIIKNLDMSTPLEILREILYPFGIKIFRH